jgi:capsular polysaccharide biosynthesis protein
MNQEEQIPSQYEEIDLIECIRVILKRKWLILILFLGAMAVAGGLSYSMPKVYKIDTSLEIGSIGGETIETPLQLAGDVGNDVYGDSVREKLNIPESEYPKIAVENPKDTNSVIMTIKSANPEESKNILGQINSLILEEYQTKIKIRQNAIEKNIKTIEAKIQLTESDIEKTRNKFNQIDEDIKRIQNKIGILEEGKENLEERIDALQKNPIYQQDPGLQVALFDLKDKLVNKEQEIENLYLANNSWRMTKEDLEVQINSFKKNIEDFNKEIDSLKTPLDGFLLTKIVKVPAISEKPIEPNISLNIAIAGILGLFLGVVLALFQEWWEKNKIKT